MKLVVKKFLEPVRELSARFVAPYLNLDHSPMKLGANYVHAEDVPGDYLEFGVFKGSSFIKAFHEINKAQKDWESIERTQAAYSDKKRANKAFKNIQRFERRFFAFDSFDGLPEPQGIDEKSARFSAGRYDCTEESFLRIIRSNGVDIERVITVPGFYHESLTAQIKATYQIKQASIVMIDCDLYESTVSVLQFVTNLLVSGSIIIFDDWFNFRGNPDLGEQKACKEWLAENPRIQLIPYVRWAMTQQSFIVNVR